MVDRKPGVRSTAADCGGRFSAVATLVLGLVMVMGVPAHPRASARPGPASAAAEAASDRGRGLYRQHCATCHGKKGRGDGKATAKQAQRPANLAELTHRRGSFPADYVAIVLHGTELTSAHETSGMMAWGAIFRAQANGDETDARRRIDDLVEYIRTLQRR